jgi:type VI secretion system protein ImpG
VPWQDRLPRTALRPGGFEPEGAAARLPVSFDGYRLPGILRHAGAVPVLHLLGLACAAYAAWRQIEITILSRSRQAVAARVRPDHMQLDCTPAINLFPKRSDRVNLSDARRNTLIVLTACRPLDYEVFSVTVREFSADGGSPQPFFPSTPPTI